jgi:hypothetical protein
MTAETKTRAARWQENYWRPPDYEFNAIAGLLANRPYNQGNQQEQDPQTNPSHD